MYSHVVDWAHFRGLPALATARGPSPVAPCLHGSGCSSPVRARIIG